MPLDFPGLNKNKCRRYFEYFCFYGIDKKQQDKLREQNNSQQSLKNFIWNMGKHL